MSSNPLESTVETHIDSTSRLVRRVDLAFSLLTVISLLLAGSLLAILADHWLLKEGLSMPLRFGIFTALFAAAGFYIYWKIVPLFRYQINPVYTADLIEKDVSTFKNSLINWILLRQEREERADMPSDKIHERMYDGIVKTAAVNVQAVPAGHAVDIRKLVIAGGIFTILLIGFFLYATLSPKNPFSSLARVLFPFGNIERPQVAQFRNVQPGDAVVLQGEKITISAEVVSRSAEPVYLVFSTDDGQAVNQRIPMSLPEGKIAFETFFPPGKQGMERGFNSSVDYRIVQGESRSRDYRLDVQPVASIEMVSLQYDFPEYTGLPAEIVEHPGSIRALEGTRVTVTARSTMPLQNIDIVFDNTTENNVSMRITDAGKTEAKGTFALTGPFRYKTFSFRATDENGHASRRSGFYPIEVVADRPPRVQWADTARHLEGPEISVPVNETLPCPIQAEDPDFALRYLRFKTESTDKRIPDVGLLDSPATGPTPHRGQMRMTVPFTPQKMGLAVGDTAEIWVEATDTKLPEANVSSTRRIKITVIDPTDKEEEEQENKEEQQKEEEQDKTGDGQSQQDEKQEQEGDNADENQSEQKEQEGKEGQEGEQQEGEQQNPDGGGGEGEQDSEGQEQNQGNSRQDDQPGEGEQENSGGGDAAGNEPSEENGGEQGSGNQPSGGNEQEGRNAEGNQPNETQQGDGTGGERTGNQSEPEPDSSVNPETQDGDAMERVVEQMKQEGLFPGENPFLRNDNQRTRSNALDPDSQNRSNRGNDPTDPRESNRPSEGEPQGQPQQQPEGPKEENQEEGAESGRAGDMDSPSGDQQGMPQEGDGTQGEQGSGGEQTDAGNQQSGEEQGGGTGDQQSQDGNPQGSNSDPSGSPTQASGTGGGEQTTRETRPDDPNLKYANEVTNMVLDYLENQLKEKPNEELLNKLGWTEDQLRQFYERWKRMSDESKQPQAKEEGNNAWVEALRSLGLLPSPARRGLRGSQTGVQDDKRVTEAQRIPVPPAIQGRFREYNDSVGK